MSKVTLISFIVVVLCINFQVKAAGLFDPSFLNPLKSAKDITNSLKHIAKGGQEAVQNIGNDALKIGKDITSGLSGEADKLKKQTEGLLNNARNHNNKANNNNKNSACNKLYSEIYSTMSQMASGFWTCVGNTTQEAGVNIQKLTDSAKIMETKLVQNMRNMAQCFQSPADLFACVTKVGNDLSEILPACEQLGIEFYDIFRLYPDLKECYMTSHFDYFQENYNSLLNDLVQCMESMA